MEGTGVNPGDSRLSYEPNYISLHWYHATLLTLLVSNHD